MSSTTVQDVMTTRVIWVEHDTPFAVIAAALRQYRVSAFPVLSPAGQVVGVVSESDLLAKLALQDDQAPAVAGGILHQQQVRKARALTAGDLMTTLPVMVRPRDSVEHAARLMYQRRIKRLPVVDADDHLVGIISRADVLAVYNRPDEEIREEAAAVAARAAPGAGAVGVAVRDGIVTLTGTAGSREAAREITRAVRHVEGVVAVRDRVSCPPSGPGDPGALDAN